MKNKLFVFGDSFTFGHNGDATFPPYVQWREYLQSDILPPEWHVILGEELKMDVINGAAMGASNDEIFHQFIDHIHEIESNDIVIINWTFLQRYRWARTSFENEPDLFCRMGTSFVESDFIDLQTHERILYNKSFPAWKEDIYNYIKIINKLSKLSQFSVFYWDTDGSILYELPDFYTNEHYIASEFIKKTEPNIEEEYNEYLNPFFKRLYKFGGVDIKRETNGYADDPTHLGQKGHELIADIFYKHIQKK